MLCSDLEVLLLPLLHMLYTASGRAPSHLYMLLIILLILTQDASFAANVHRVQLSSVPWYRERLLNKTLLGESILLQCSCKCKRSEAIIRSSQLWGVMLKLT